MAEDKAKWMSIGEAAEFMGVSRDTLRRWEKKGKIQPVRSPTNRRYYTQKHLEEVMAGKFEQQAEEKKPFLTKKESPKVTQVPQKPGTPKPKSGKKTLKIFLIGLLSFLIAAAIGAVVFFFVL